MRYVWDGDAFSAASSKLADRRDVNKDFYFGLDLSKGWKIEHSHNKF